MGTNNQTPNLSPDYHQLLNNLHTEFSGLAHRTVSFSWGVLGILVLVIGMMFGGGYLALKHFDAQLERADQHNAQFVQLLKDSQAQFTQHESERAQLQQQLSDLQAQMAKRSSQPLPPVVQGGLSPNASSEAVKNALEALISSPSSPEALTLTPDSKIALTASQGQKTASLIVEGNKDKDLLALQTQIGSVQAGQIASLTQDLKQCRQVELPAAQKQINDYKKAAEKSKFRKFLDGAEKVGIFAAGVMAGSLHR